MKINSWIYSVCYKALKEVLLHMTQPPLVGNESLIDSSELVGKWLMAFGYWSRRSRFKPQHCQYDTAGLLSLSSKLGCAKRIFTVIHVSNSTVCKTMCPNDYTLSLRDTPLRKKGFDPRGPGRRNTDSRLSALAGERWCRSAARSPVPAALPDGWLVPPQSQSWSWRSRRCSRCSLCSYLLPPWRTRLQGTRAQPARPAF